MCIFWGKNECRENIAEIIELNKWINADLNEIHFKMNVLYEVEDVATLCKAWYAESFPAHSLAEIPVTVGEKYQAYLSMEW